ncbi:MAG TPA: glycosyltransferase [Pyrinomonadaceae bacterium]|nr:glycosyltransferase [Pyrinomonadaceae bacterium]
MNSNFESDPFPGRPRILFIGLGENSHTHSWIELLTEARLNVRLFSMPSGLPPEDWPVRTYITSYENPPLNPETRALLYPANSAARFAKRQVARLAHLPNTPALAARWLARIIREWQPDIIHTLGVVQGGEFYLEARRKFKLEGIGKWVLQTRGGSDLTIPHLDPERRPRLAEVLAACDQLICDNEEDLRIAAELGLQSNQRASIAPVPGTGGIDVSLLSGKWQVEPAKRRAIIFPKAYDSAWGKVLPSYEALKLCWDRIQPCEIHLLSMSDESFMWFWTLPENIRRSCHTYRRIPRDQVLDLMPRARVMSATALTDGVPNSLYEAMAAGAFPIVSPLDTIRPVVKSEENVLFARDLYPNEIAASLERAMNDDRLVASATKNNLELVTRIAGRETIRPRVIEYYENLSS